jgi:hypothetical protein
VSDEALARLHQPRHRRAHARQSRHSPDPGHPKTGRKTCCAAGRPRTRKPPGSRRLHGHLTDDDLDRPDQPRQEHSRTDTTINDPAAAKARWLAFPAQGKALRELMHPEVRADEAYERGAVTNYSRDENAPASAPQTRSSAGSKPK